MAVPSIGGAGEAVAAGQDQCWRAPATQPAARLPAAASSVDGCVIGRTLRNVLSEPRKSSAREAEPGATSRQHTRTQAKVEPPSALHLARGHFVAERLRIEVI